MDLLKHLLIFTMTFSLALSSDDFFGNNIPSSKQAIDFSVSKKGNNYFINFILLEDVYVYKNKLKILKDSEEITFKIIGKTIIQKDKFFGEQEILGENFVISFKSYDYVSKEQIQLEYQGCFANKVCFNKEIKKLSI
tara:strand:+ start:43 stop:453 length:411 start_codon:yes stop_codon:yes gene_type:complete